MNRKCYRFYGGLIGAQEKWLNKMAAEGYRLIRVEKLLYEFEECGACQYQYRVEFIGHKSKQSADDYANFLRDCGYRVFYKNINLNYSVGKVVFRPWAETGGRISTTADTYNRELLIVEKENDGSDFALHTTYEDRIAYCKQLQRPWLFLFLLSAALGVALRSWVWAVFAAISAVGLTAYQVRLSGLKRAAKSREW